MNLLELVTHLRRNVLYDTGGTGVDWATYTEANYDSIQLRWTNEELTANINEAINQVYRRTSPIRATVNISAVANTAAYSLASYVLKVINIRRANGHSIPHLSALDFYDETNGTKGDIDYYVTDDVTDTITLFPTPTVNETLVATVYRGPLTKLVWTSNTLSPELKEIYQVPMLNYAAGMAYMKDEANTLDPKRAQSLFEAFDREFPFTSAYSNIRKGRTARNPVRYGGY